MKSYTNKEFCIHHVTKLKLVFNRECPHSESCCRRTSGGSTNGQLAGTSANPVVGSDKNTEETDTRECLNNVKNNEKTNVTGTGMMMYCRKSKTKGKMSCDDAPKGVKNDVSVCTAQERFVDRHIH